MSGILFNHSGFTILPIFLAYVLDRILGDPHWLPHPVVGMGKLIYIGDRFLNQGRYRKAQGVLMVLLLLTIVGGLVIVLLWGVYGIHPYLGALLEGVLIWSTIAVKGLGDAARMVAQPLQQKDFTSARQALGRIVGRDTTNLDEGEIVRGTVETVAENTCDAVIAPLFYAFFGGAVGAILYRMVNTCDAMVGYRNERYLEFGWSSARLDDLLNWLPSRLTALLMLLVNRPALEISWRRAWQVMRRDARKHPSPNSGFGEATTAALLGVQLGGRNYYQGSPEDRPRMGDPIYPLVTKHIEGAIQIMERTTLAMLLLIGLGGVFYVLP